MKGYCGINCSECECYKATQENDVLKKMDIAIKWSKLFNRTILPREIECSGCKSDGVKFSQCEICKIRQQHTENELLKKSS